MFGRFWTIVLMYENDDMIKKYNVVAEKDQNL